MSWDVYLRGDDVKVPHHEDGGTYQLGGTSRPWLNVTYNYGKHFHFGEQLHMQRAGDTIEILEKRVRKLGTVRDPNYWNPTEGNVGYACSILLNWAIANPDAIWDVH